MSVEIDRRSSASNEKNEPVSALDCLAAGLDADGAVDDRDESPFLHLVVAERLAGLERDEHSARGLVGPEHDRRTDSGRSLDLAQVPALHGGDPKERPHEGAVRLKRP